MAPMFSRGVGRQQFAKARSPSVQRGVTHFEANVFDGTPPVVPPPQTLARIVNLAANGDSLTAWERAVNTSATYNSLKTSNRGWLGWLGQLLGNNYTVQQNVAVSGSRIPQHLGYADALVSATPQADILFYHPAGTNDLSATTDTVSTLQANYTATFAKMAAINGGTVRIIGSPIWPRDVAGVTPAQNATNPLPSLAREADRKSFNAWLKNTFYASQANARLVDHEAILVRPGLDYGLNPALTIDGVHLTVPAAKQVAEAVYAAMDKPTPIVHPLALAVDTGNLVPSYTLQGTGGQLFYATGVVPTNWSVNANANRGAQAAVFAKVAGVETDVISMTMSGTAPAAPVSNSNIQITSTTLAAGSLIPGKTYRHGFKLKAINLQNCVQIALSANYTVLGSPSVQYQMFAFGYYSSTIDDGDVLPSTLEIPVIGPSFTIPDGASATVQLVFNIAFKPGAPVSGELQLSRPYLREHIYRPVWPPDTGALPSSYRLTETGDRRITEAGDTRALQS